MSRLCSSGSLPGRTPFHPKQTSSWSDFPRAHPLPATPLSVPINTDGYARGGSRSPYLPFRRPHCTLNRLRAEEYDRPVTQSIATPEPSSRTIRHECVTTPGSQQSPEFWPFSPALPVTLGWLLGRDKWGLSFSYHVATTYPFGQPGSSSLRLTWRYHGKTFIRPSLPECATRLKVFTLTQVRDPRRLCHHFCGCHLQSWRSFPSEYWVWSWIFFHNVTSEHNSTFLLLKLRFQLWILKKTEIQYWRGMNFSAHIPCFVDHLFCFWHSSAAMPGVSLFSPIIFHCCLCTWYFHYLRHRNELVR